MARFTQHPIARWLSLHASVGSLLLPMTVLAEDPAGRVMFIHGNATIERDGERTDAERGDDIFAGDTFRTQSASTLQIRYSDGGTKAIQPESTYTLESYANNEENPEESEQSGELLKGGLRAVTGAIGRNAPENVSHKTPVATMGIRGTSFQVLHVPEGSTPPLPGMGTGSYLYVESGMLSMNTDAGERLVRPGDVVFTSAADATPELLADGINIFEQLEEQRSDMGDDEDDSDDAQQNGAEPGIASATLDTDTNDDDNDATTGTFFDNVALAPASTEQLQRDQTNNLANQQSTNANALSDDIEDELASEPEVWIDFPPTYSNSLAPGDYRGYLNDFYDENIAPTTEPSSQSVADGEVVWGYWDEDTPDPFFPEEEQPIGSYIPFISVSDELANTMSTTLGEQALFAMGDQLTEGVTFNWTGGTGLVAATGGEVIPILDESTITLASTGTKSSIAVNLLLEEFGSLVGGQESEEGSAAFEAFALDSITLVHSDCEPDCFDGTNTLQGRYIGDNAEAIMSLIEAASYELGNYSGTGLLER